jgi:hypothetical protein
MKKNYVKEYKGYKVPEGATCFVEASSFNSNHFGKEVGGVEFIFCIDDNEPEWYEVSAISTPLSQRGAIELPEAPQEWNGEGLPPVGTVCEYQVHRSQFGKCLVMGYFEGLVWMTSHHETSPYSGCHTTLVGSTLTFRPLKTQQEKDREAFIDAARKATNADVNDVVATDIFDDMYHAGFTAPKADDYDQE